MMKNLIVILCLLLPFFEGVHAQLIPFQGKEYFVNGINVPWINFGWDFGEHHEWGVGYEPMEFEAIFADLAANGVNCIRIWLHCDGRANPEFDENGYVSGLEPSFFEHLDDFFDRAEAHQLMVIPVLWSHDLLMNHRENAGQYAGMHKDLITDAAKTDSYLQNALIPMIEHYKDQCNILAWELFSEPEWCMKGRLFSPADQKVEVHKMQTFIAKMIQTIRMYSDQMITVGAALPLEDDTGELNYWHEANFELLGFDCSQVYLDFYTFHYFDWMSNGNSPFNNPASHWNLMRPVLVGECSLKGTEEIRSSLDHCFDTGYAGVMMWAYNDVDEYSDWVSYEIPIKEFCEANPASILYEADCDYEAAEPMEQLCNLYPNPFRENLQIFYHLKEGANLQLVLYDLAGQLVSTHAIDGHLLDTSNWGSGAYVAVLYRLEDGVKTRVVSSQKVVRL